MERKFLELGSTADRRRLSYLEAGAPDNPRVVLCVHGMTRNGRDFGRLAEVLAADARVICPDVAGRGESDYLADPTGYQIPTYVGDMLALIAHLDVPSVDWIGTSMGGVIGMAVAGASDPTISGVIKRLVLNDIGPFVPKAALERIAEYVTGDRTLADLAEAEISVRETYAPFGLRTDAEWRWMTEVSFKPDGNGGVVPNYDPAIGDAYEGVEVGDAENWSLWDVVDCPVLVLRGAESDILLAETARDMTRRGPNASLVTFDGIGHAPALLSDDQIGAITDWFADTA